MSQTWPMPFWGLLELKIISLLLGNLPPTICFEGGGSLTPKSLSRKAWKFQRRSKANYSIKDGIDEFLKSTETGKIQYYQKMYKEIFSEAITRQKKLNASYTKDGQIFFDKKSSS